MIELVHVNVYQKLAGEIAQGQADVRSVLGVETSDHFAQKQDRISAPDMFFQNITQNLMIDIGEEFSDIAFKNPDRPRVILRNFASLIAEAIYCSVRAFDAPTRVRIENELGIEVRIQNPIYGVMQ